MQKENKKMSSIRISPKHGVNPTIGKCMWCGESTGEMAFLGRIKGDEKAPMYSVLSYEPCDKCKEIWNQGVAFIECTPNEFEDGRPPFTKDDKGKPIFPTGAVTVLRPEAANRIFVGEFEAGKICAMDTESFKWLQSLINESKENEGEYSDEIN